MPDPVPAPAEDVAGPGQPAAARVVGLVRLHLDHAGAVALLGEREMRKSWGNFSIRENVQSLRKEEEGGPREVD